MKNIPLRTWLRTGILILILLFAVLCGNFLYTGASNEPSLLDTTSSEPLTEGSSITQYFTPQYSYLTNISIALDKGGNSDMAGSLVLCLLDSSSDKILYESTISLSALAEFWYLDFPVNKRLNTAHTYYVTISTFGCLPDSQPSLLLAAPGTQAPENLNYIYQETGGSNNFSFGEEPNSDKPEQSVAVRYTYNVLVPTRLLAFLSLLVGIVLCFIATFILITKIPKDYSLRSFLTTPVFGTSYQVIHVGMFVTITLAAIILRVAFLPVKSNDYYLCYESWIQDMRTHGGITSLGNNIGDYPPLYMTLVTLLSYLPFRSLVIIKLLPCAFDFILAIVCTRFLSLLHKNHIVQQISLYALILLNPITLFNSAAWGQCDSLYTVFALLALFGLCQPSSRKWYASGDGIGILFAIAFSLKLQAVFLLPIFGLMLILQRRNRIKPVHFLWLPIVYTITCIPMYLAGRDLKAMFKIYLGQTNRNYGTLTLNYPNLFTFIGSSSDNLYQSYFVLGLILTFLTLLLFYYWIFCRKVSLSAVTLCKAAAVSILLICFFLPTVHERYAYLAEMLLCIIIMVDVSYWKITIPTLLCTLFTYCTYLYQIERTFLVAPEWIIALIRLGCILFMIWDIMREENTDTNENVIS